MLMWCVTLPDSLPHYTTRYDVVLQVDDGGNGNKAQASMSSLVTVTVTVTDVADVTITSIVYKTPVVSGRLVCEA